MQSKHWNVSDLVTGWTFVRRSFPVDKNRGLRLREHGHNPKILLADEPTGALDSKSGEQIMELFQKLNEEGVTIVMITHDPHIASNAKRMVKIIDGEIFEGDEKEDAS